MPKNILRHFRWKRDADKQGPREMAVVELSRGVARLARLSRTNNGVVCEGTVRFEETEQEKDDTPTFLARILTEADLKSPYLSVLLNRGEGILRTLSIDKRNDSEQMEAQIRDSLGVEEDWSVSYQIIKNAKSTAGEDTQTAAYKSEAENIVLAGALMQSEVDALQDVVVDSGFIPVSLVTNGITVANVAVNSASATASGAIGFLEISEQSSVLVIFANGGLKLIRQFRSGTYDFVNTIMKNYGLDKETSLKLLTSGSFDFSTNIGDELSSWIRQLGISLKFIERKEGCSVEKLYILERTEGVQTLESFFNEQLGIECSSWEIADDLPILDSSSLEGRKMQSAFALVCAEGQRIMKRQEERNNNENV